MSNNRGNRNLPRANVNMMNVDDDSKSTASTVPNQNIAQRNAEVNEMLDQDVSQSIPANATPVNATRVQGGRNRKSRKSRKGGNRKSRKSRKSGGAHRKGHKGHKSRKSHKRRHSRRH